MFYLALSKKPISWLLFCIVLLQRDKAWMCLLSGLLRATNFDLPTTDSNVLESYKDMSRDSGDALTRIRLAVTSIITAFD